MSHFIRFTSFLSYFLWPCMCVRVGDSYLSLVVRFRSRVGVCVGWCWWCICMALFWTYPTWKRARVRFSLDFEPTRQLSPDFETTLRLPSDFLRPTQVLLKCFRRYWTFTSSSRHADGLALQLTPRSLHSAFFDASAGRVRSRRGTPY